MFLTDRMDNKTSSSYIYLLQDGNDIGGSVYKVGRTTQKGDTRILRRVRSYSYGSILKFARCVPCDKVKSLESSIKTLFRSKYRLSRGTEWFEGDAEAMRRDIENVLNDTDTSNEALEADTGDKDEVEADVGADTAVQEKEPCAKQPSQIPTRHMQASYTCPRCGYETRDKTHIKRHLWPKTRHCGADVNDIELTEDIKNKIMQNRVYKPPAVPTPTQIINNYHTINF
jgi:hypothetical protein